MNKVASTSEFAGEEIDKAYPPLTNEELIEVLRLEIKPAMGCTEVGAAALVASKVCEALGKQPEKLHLSVSISIYKNGVNVGIPGTQLKGLVYSAALGALISDSSLGLNVFDKVDEEKITAACEQVKDGVFSVSCDKEAPASVYLKATAFAGDDEASVIIQGRHDAVVSVVKNGKVLESVATGEDAPASDEDILMARLSKMSVRSIIENCQKLDLSKIEFLGDAARTNQAAANFGLYHEFSTLGPALKSTMSRDPKVSAVDHVRAVTGSASEARMRGLPVQICSLSGSGNHGITAFTAVDTYASEINAPQEARLRALAIASFIAILVKVHTGRVTSYCGCAIAPGVGVAAATVYLNGGSIDQMVQAMQSVVGTFSGMICDGAKVSCAYKVSTVASTAVQFGHLALHGANVPAGDGIVSDSIEETFKNLGTLNNPGMVDTDRAVLGMLKSPE